MNKKPSTCICQRLSVCMYIDIRSFFIFIHHKEYTWFFNWVHSWEDRNFTIYCVVDTITTMEEQTLDSLYSTHLSCSHPQRRPGSLDSAPTGGAFLALFYTTHCTKEECINLQVTTGAIWLLRKLDKAPNPIPTSMPALLLLTFAQVLEDGPHGIRGKPRQMGSTQQNKISFLQLGV